MMIAVESVVSTHNAHHLSVFRWKVTDHRALDPENSDQLNCLGLFVAGVLFTNVFVCGSSSYEEFFQTNTKIDKYYQPNHHLYPTFHFPL